MLSLHTLKNSERPFKSVKRVGRGPGSKSGKTCGRGSKGAGSRSGYKTRESYEGGQFRMFRKLPVRGFSNAAFRDEMYVINLRQIEQWFQDGEVINETSLRDKKLIKGHVSGIKILGDGEISKKVTIEANAYSATAKEKLEGAGVKYTQV